MPCSAKDGAGMTTHGEKLIRVSFNDPTMSQFYSISKELLTQQERLVYDFVDGFITRYSRYPTSEAMREAGFEWVDDANEGFGYYFDLLLNRSRITTSATLINRLLDLTQNNQGGEVLRVVEQALNDLYAMENTVLSLSSVPWYDSFMQELMARRNSPASTGRVTTGYVEEDEATGGYRNGELYVIAGRPKSGKTHVLGYKALQAWETNKSVSFISMEMSRTPIHTLLASQVLGISERVLDQHILPTPFLNYLMYHFDTLRDRPAFNVHTAGLGTTTTNLLPILLRENPDVVYIDAVYRMRPTKTTRDRFQDLSNLVEELKALCLRLNKPLVVTAQLGRSTKSTVDGNVDDDALEGSDKYKQEAALITTISSKYAERDHNFRVLSAGTNRFGSPIDPFSIRFDLNPYAPDNYQSLGWFDPNEVQTVAPQQHTTGQRQSNSNPFYAAQQEREVRNARGIR